ncbi:hypothetical protein SARC_03224 [Sphaeroforma arctica JP610]|uniref:Uncharacterized protein n=1 Tax=Sphaeroforma arctica JP610 TaxID=667725 RepID=A0A0L0G6P4_9EUKA|nr:hypothetical protein SARC_03224 [Sphaeroforma arctica JP610]KNC84551.1 hypothetical protein SARC_03224 [Sphaeroforma arctica JP610]|eukprot:XP_014158453.1 hypothetical protein SARC_03224 [Sphaeroforma arctica JP610]
MAVKTHKTIDTIYSADTVEWCPIPELADVLVCGTYQLLQESEQTVNSASNTTDNPDCDAVSTDHPHSESAEEASSKNRAGRCLMYALNHDDSVLNEVARCDANAILDVKWRREASNHNGAVAALFATVDSVGGTVVYKVSQRETAIDGPDKTSAPSSSTHDAYALEACASHTNTHFDEACGTELLNLACEWTYGMGKHSIILP